MLWPTIESPVDKKVEVEINLKKWSRCFHELKVNETVHPSFETEEMYLSFRLKYRPLGSRCDGFEACRSAPSQAGRELISSKFRSRVLQKCRRRCWRTHPHCKLGLASAHEEINFVFFYFYSSGKSGRTLAYFWSFTVASGNMSPGRHMNFGGFQDKVLGKVKQNMVMFMTMTRPDENCHFHPLHHQYWHWRMKNSRSENCRWRGFCKEKCVTEKHDTQMRLPAYLIETSKATNGRRFPGLPWTLSKPTWPGSKDMSQNTTFEQK